MNTQPKEFSTATLQMSTQPAVPQGHYYTYKFYALHTNHLPTFLKRIAANSVSGNSAHHSSIFLLFLNHHHRPQCPCTPPRCHLRLFNAATHNAHHPQRWSPTTITQWPTWQCHVTNRTNGHIDVRQRRWEPKLPCRSWQRGCQMMDNDEVSPPSPLLFANPGARCHVSDVATRWRTIIIRRPISTEPNTTTTDGRRRWQWW